ncbi:MAG: PRC-barrel domain-containing protein [Thermodesulfobacteriota bacterium]
MKRILSALAVLSILSFGLFEAGSHAETMAQGGWHTYEIRQLLNYGVRNPQGEFLGRTEDFVIDSNGRILFVIVSKPGMLGIRGEPVAVPFQTLSFGSRKNELVLNMSWEKFAAAPHYDKKAGLENSAWAADVYRYFGIQPYWTE